MYAGCSNPARIFAEALVLPPSVKKKRGLGAGKSWGVDSGRLPISILTANQYMQPDPALQLCQLQNT
jgi:hypothetical protein